MSAAYDAGVAAFHARDYDAARQHFERVTAIRHDLPEGHFYLGLICRAQAQLEDAADCLLLATSFQADFPEAWFFLGVVAHERKLHADAREYFGTALRWRPDYADAHQGLGKVAETSEEFDVARVHYLRAIEYNPRLAPAYNNLAYVTFRGRLDDAAALEWADKALELDPELTDAHRTRAQILQYQGRCREAIFACKEALKRAPNDVNTRMIKALAELMTGDFEAGWRDYETRKQVYPIFQIRAFPYPEWDGSDPRGRRMLVYHEQGLGDEIMFASCLPDLFTHGAECIVECSPRLERLFRRSFPRATLVVGNQNSPDLSHLSTLPACDWQVAAGSLPRFLRRTLSAFPRHHGYLTADAARVAYWRERLRALGDGLKIGLSWRGGEFYTNQPRRSIELQRLLPLLSVPETTFVSLQYGDCRDDIAAVNARCGITLHHWQDAIDDYDETAALVTALDQVISVQTAVIHLAGALGKSAWVLVPVTAEWRYMAQGEHMPWYPSVRLLRQPRGHGWEPVIAAVVRELTAGGTST